MYYIIEQVACFVKLISNKTKVITASSIVHFFAFGFLEGVLPIPPQRAKHFRGDLK
jgi:hypothetical protein